MHHILEKEEGGGFVIIRWSYLKPTFSPGNQIRVIIMFFVVAVIVVLQRSI